MGTNANMSLLIPENFQHILRVMNTNLEGKRNTMFAITAIKGVGRRFANIALKKADIDMSKRAGELTEEEVERIVTIISTPRPLAGEDVPSVSPRRSNLLLDVLLIDHHPV